MNKIFKYFYIIPISLGSIFILLALSGIISDSVGESGILIEDGFRAFAGGCALVIIGLFIRIVIYIVNNIYSRSR